MPLTPECDSLSSIDVSDALRSLGEGMHDMMLAADAGDGKMPIAAKIRAAPIIRVLRVSSTFSRRNRPRPFLSFTALSLLQVDCSTCNKEMGTRGTPTLLLLDALCTKLPGPREGVKQTACAHSNAETITARRFIIVAGCEDEE